jgi:large subunit ribosomal protein L22
MATTITASTPQARAILRYHRASAFKVREVLDLIRGKSVEDARGILRFGERGPTEPILKLLNSAAANAENNLSVPDDELFVAFCYADEGPTLKRWRPRARGRATRIRKRTCHITIVVARYSEDELTRLRRGESTTQADRRRRLRRRREQEVADKRARKQAAREEAAHEHDHDHDEHDHEHAEGGDEAAVHDHEHAHEGEAHEHAHEHADGTDHEHDAHDHAHDDADAETGEDADTGEEAAEAAPLIAEDTLEAGADAAAAPYGEGSAAPLPDGSQPAGHPIKGNEDSMMYHEPGGRWYDQTIAEVWFATPEAAEAAGFRAPGSEGADDADEGSASDGTADAGDAGEES